MRKPGKNHIVSINQAACLLFFLLFAQPVSLVGQPVDHLLIGQHDVQKTVTQEEDLWFYDDAGSVTRYTPVVLGDFLTGKSVARRGDNLRLNLFPGVQKTAVIERVYTNVNGTMSVRAALQPPGSGYVLLSETGGRTLGLINIRSRGNNLYRITSDPVTGTHYLVELNREKMDEIHDCPLMHPPYVSEQEKKQQKQVRKQLEEKGLGPDDHAAVDIMIVYTPAARDWANANEGGIENTIAIAMEIAQMVSELSELNISFRLVHTRLVEYEEAENAGTDLRRLTASTTFNPWGQEHDGEAIPGFMNAVHDWRDEYGADLVGLFTRRADVGGLGWQLTNRFGLQNYGFSLTRVQQASWTYTHIHEVGHNMGAHHHKEQSEETDPGPGVFDYSAGWRWTGVDGGHYASVMTYESGQWFEDGIDHQRTPYFSNPQVFHQEVPTGHPVDGDNARTLREMKHVIGAYRTKEIDAVKGIVYDMDGVPVKGAKIAVEEVGAIIYTKKDGTFSIPYLPAGENLLHVYKTGFYPIEEVVNIIPGETRELEFQLVVLTDVHLTGFVAYEEDKVTGVDGAMIRITRGNEVYTAKTDQGLFVMEDFPGGFTYDVMAAMPGYDVHKEEAAVGMDYYSTLDTIYLRQAFLPVDEIRAEVSDDRIDIFWDAPSFIGEYRYDGGSPVSGLGFPEAQNSLLGAAHRRHAWIDNVSWLSTGDSEERVNLRILGLTSDGKPNRGDLLYEALDINNNPGQWSHYELEETLYAPYGFFVGVGAKGVLYLAIDEHNFRPGTNFATSDFGRFDLQDMVDTDFKNNFFIRAYGYDFGRWLKQDKKMVQGTDYVVPLDIDLSESHFFWGPVSVIKEPYLGEPTGYNIFLADTLNGFHSAHAENISETSYRFSGLPDGRYYAGVQAIYPDGLSEITAKRIFSGTPIYYLALYAEPADGGVVATEGLYRENQMVELDAVAYAGYYFVSWKDDDDKVISYKPRVNYLMPSKDTHLTAYFLEDPAGPAELSVYPNPVTGRLNIVADQTIQEIRLYNLTGQLVYSTKDMNNSLFQLNLSGISEGLFILQVQTESGWHTERIRVFGNR